MLYDPDDGIAGDDTNNKKASKYNVNDHDENLHNSSVMPMQAKPVRPSW